MEKSQGGNNDFPVRANERKNVPKEFYYRYDRSNRPNHRDGNWISSFLFKRQKLLSHLLITQLPIKVPNNRLVVRELLPSSSRAEPILSRSSTRTFVDLAKSRNWLEKKEKSIRISNFSKSSPIQAFAKWKIRRVVKMCHSTKLCWNFIRQRERKKKQKNKPRFESSRRYWLKQSKRPRSAPRLSRGERGTKRQRNGQSPRGGERESYGERVDRQREKMA